jgi:NADH pyrophosphatase NudC (nudix superfamily)
MSSKFIKKKTERRNVTVRHSQERIAMLANAKNHGQIFHATGGETINSDDALLAIEKNVREASLRTLLKKKKLAQKMSDFETKGREVLVRLAGVDINAYRRDKDLLPLLKWYQVKGADGMPVAKAKEEWRKCCSKDPEREFDDYPSHLLCRILNWVGIRTCLKGKFVAQYDEGGEGELDKGTCHYWWRR